MSDPILDSRLRENLRPLALLDIFIDKVLASARDAAACLPTETARVRIMVFTSASSTPKNHTWGFFRVVKTHGDPHDPLAGTVEIAFYLYAEGSTSPG